MRPLPRALALAAMGTLAACHARPPMAAPSAATSANRPPSVRVRCQPCSIAAGGTVTISADATDPDHDRLSYAWSAPSGAIAAAGAQQTSWTAPPQDGPVPVAITVTDGKGGLASDAITIQVTKIGPPAAGASPHGQPHSD